MWRFGVRRLGDLVDHVMPVFEEHPLKMAKEVNFLAFCQIVAMMRDRVHLSMGGLERIATISSTMNRRKPSRLMESSEAIRQPSQHR